MHGCNTAGAVSLTASRQPHQRDEKISLALAEKLAQLAAFSAE
jgi:hypothetical protein